MLFEQLGAALARMKHGCPDDRVCVSARTFRA